MCSFRVVWPVLVGAHSSGETANKPRLKENWKKCCATRRRFVSFGLKFSVWWSDKRNYLHGNPDFSCCRERSRPPWFFTKVFQFTSAAKANLWRLCLIRLCNRKGRLRRSSVMNYGEHLLLLHQMFCTWQYYNTHPSRVHPQWWKWSMLLLCHTGSCGGNRKLFWHVILLLHM